MRFLWRFIVTLETAGPGKYDRPTKSSLKKLSQNSQNWAKTKAFIGPIEQSAIHHFPALKAPELASPGQRPGFRGYSIAQESSALSGRERISGGVPGALPLVFYLHAVGVKMRWLFQTLRNVEKCRS
jgi:hypothetical protein